MNSIGHQFHLLPAEKKNRQTSTTYESISYWLKSKIPHQIRKFLGNTMVKRTPERNEYGQFSIRTHIFCSGHRLIQTHDMKVPAIIKRISLKSNYFGINQYLANIFAGLFVIIFMKLEYHIITFVSRIMYGKIGNENKSKQRKIHPRFSRKPSKHLKSHGVDVFV